LFGIKRAGGGRKVMDRWEEYEKDKKKSLIIYIDVEEEKDI
jgi:hypothetical protein